MTEYSPNPLDRAESKDEARPTDHFSSLVYDQLRDLARKVMSSSPSAGVDPTDIVHECYVRLSRTESVQAMKPTNFLAMAASILRRILVDLARTQSANKRGGGWERTTLSSAAQSELSTNAKGVDLLNLDEALLRLEKSDPRQHRIVELRFFAGMSGDQIAEELGVSRRTVTKEWQIARAWLRRAMEG